MFKLMHKKLNKKGFTLAELLVVVAIVAILVAIAIPIFTESLKEAQIRTNAANIRSTKAAAVEHILANWNKLENSASGYSAINNRYYRDGASGSKNGWYAIGHVDAVGNMVEVHVFVNLSGTSTTRISSDSIKEGIITSDTQFTAPTATTEVENSAHLSPEYYTLVYVNDTDIKKGNG